MENENGLPKLISFQAWMDKEGHCKELCDYAYPDGKIQSRDDLIEGDRRGNSAYQDIEEIICSGKFSYMKFNLAD